MGNKIISGTLKNELNEKIINLIVDELKKDDDTPIYIYTIGVSETSVFSKIFNVLDGKNYLSSESIDKERFLKLASKYKVVKRLNIVVFNHDKVVELTSFHRRPKFHIMQDKDAIVFGYDIYIEAIVHSILVSIPNATITVNPLSDPIFYLEENLRNLYQIDSFIYINN